MPPWRKWLEQIRLKRLRTVRPVVWVIGAVCLIVIILFITQPSPRLHGVQEPTLNVAAISIQQQQLSPQVQLLGQAEARTISTLNSTVNAFVDQTFASPGQQVQKGQLLIRLNGDDVNLLVRQRQAEANDIAAQIEREKLEYQRDLRSLQYGQQLLQLSQAELQRQQSLIAKGFVSASALDKAKENVEQKRIALSNRYLQVQEFASQLQGLQAQWQKAKSLLDQALLDQRRLNVVAPFNGVIIENKVSTGERVSPGEPLLTLYDPQAVEIRAQIPQHYEKRIAEAASKQPLAAHVVGHHTEVALALARVSGHVFSGQISRSAYFKLVGGQQAKIAPGESFVVLLSLPAIQAFAVPPQALYLQKQVYVIKDQRLQAVPVQVAGSWYDAKHQRYMLLQSHDLHNQDDVMATQVPQARDGLKVRVTHHVTIAQ